MPVFLQKYIIAVICGGLLAVRLCSVEISLKELDPGVRCRDV